MFGRSKQEAMQSVIRSLQMDHEVMARAVTDLTHQLDSHQLRIQQLETQVDNLLEMSEMQREMLHNIGTQVQGVTRLASDAVQTLNTVSRTMRVASGASCVDLLDDTTGE